MFAVNVQALEQVQPKDLDASEIEIDAYSIMEETLNLRTVTIRDRIEDGDGKYHYEVNKKETMLASCMKVWSNIWMQPLIR